MYLKLDRVKLKAFYKLARLNTIMDFFPILGILSVFGTRSTINIATIVTLICMLFLFLSAFIINDINDADDDAMDPKKALRNPISAKILTLEEAYNFFFLISLIGLVPLLFVSINSFIVGLAIFIVGYLYSAKPIRLKARVLLDILSHGFFLAAAQIIMFSQLPGSVLDKATITMAIAVYIFSMGGDLYNESRDWEVDRLSGLKNTSHYLGFKTTRILSISFYVLGVALVVASTVTIIFKL